MADQTSTLKVLITAQNQTNAAFSQMNNSLNGLKTAALAVAGTLAAALSFANVIDSTRKWGAEIDQLQDQLGGTAEQMSKLNFIAQSVGLSTDELSQTFGILNKRVFDSAEEIAKGTSVFDKWGISLKDADGNIVGFDESMRRIKTRFQEIGQGAQGTALLLDIFGKSGKTLSDFLALTDDEMRTMIQDAQDFGLVLGGNASESIQRFNRDIYRLQLQFEGLKVQLGLFLIPLLSALISIVSKALGFIKQLGEAIGRMLGPLKEWIDKVGGVKAIGDALLIIGAALLGLAALGGLIGLVGWLGRLALAALPILSVAAGLGLIALAIKDIADTWNGNGDTWDKIIKTVGDIGVAFIGLGLILLPFSATAAIIVVAIGLVTLAISEVIATVKTVTDNWETFVKALKEGKLNDIPVFGFFFEKAQLVMKWIDDIGGAWSTLERALNGKGPPGQTPHQSPDAQDRTNPPRETPTTNIPGAVQGGLTGSNIGSLFGPVGSAIGGAVGALIGGKPFASGGVVMRPTNALIGEAGPEAVIPLGRSGGMFGGVTVNVTVNGGVDSRERIGEISDGILRALFAQRNLSF